MDIQIPDSLLGPLLDLAAARELSVEEIVEHAISDFLKWEVPDAEYKHKGYLRPCRPCTAPGRQAIYRVQWHDYERIRFYCPGQ